MALTELALKNLKPKEKCYLVRDDEGLVEVLWEYPYCWRVLCQGNR